MSRYNDNNGGSNGDNYEDDTTLKLQQYAAIRVEPDNLNSASHNQYGTSFIVNFEDAEVLDGIVFQRDDKPDTWKVFSAGKFFNLNPEDGLVYENFSEDDGYTGEMSAQDILDHPRVAGFSETFGGQDYFYTAVGVVIEEAGQIAVNDDVEVETTSEPSIEVGGASMLLSNKSWTRTFAKKMAASGNGVINDNGDDPTPRGEPDTNPKYDDHEWLATENPSLRPELDGRALELWLTDGEMDVEDGNTVEYTTPNVLDSKTGNRVTIDNGVESDDGSEANTDKATATDGGTATESSESSATDSPQEPQTTEEPAAPTDTDSAGLPEDVPEVLDDLIDYMARNGETDADEIREFAADEVDNPDDIDWEAAANEANQRAE